MVDRHKGIATESAFSLAMFRWANKIIEFIRVVRQIQEIGIIEIEAKVTGLTQFRSQIESLLKMRKDDDPFMMFGDLR